MAETPEPVVPTREQIEARIEENNRKIEDIVNQIMTGCPHLREEKKQEPEQFEDLWTSFLEAIKGDRKNKYLVDLSLKGLRSIVLIEKWKSTQDLLAKFNDFALVSAGMFISKPEKFEKIIEATFALNNAWKDLTTAYETK